MSSPQARDATVTTSVQSLEQFSTARGLTTQTKAFMFINAGLRSLPDRKGVRRRYHQRIDDLYAEVDAAEQLYRAALASGEVIAPSRPTDYESKTATACGHPDRADVQAARRICVKRGWWTPELEAQITRSDAIYQGG